MTRRAPPRLLEPVEFEANGVTYRGSYYVEKGMVTVNSMYGTRSATVSASNAMLARMMLRELVQEATIRGDL
jgi:hypothetical protein